MKVKKIVAGIILLLICVFSLAACSDNKDAVPDGNGNGTEAEIVITTDLTDNATVTEKNFSFNASAKCGGADCEIEAVCNGILLAQKDGAYTVNLRKGENDIELTAISGAEKLTQTYIVLYRVELEILTDLETAEIFNDVMKFSVNATFNGLPCAGVVEYNGGVINPVDGSYRVNLITGENIFLITARYGDYIEQREYKIAYDGFNLNTNLKDADTDTAEYVFRAVAAYGDTPCSLTVELNGEAVKPDGGRYGLTLIKGENVVILTAEYEGFAKQYAYTVRYFDDPPTLSVSINDNTVYRSSLFSFDVKAADGMGRKLAKEQVSFFADWNVDDGIENFVAVNGISLVWDDSTMTSYRINFKNGDFANHSLTPFNLKITATDNSGKNVSLIYTMTYRPTDYGGEIGEVVFALEGFSISCGYFIEPVKVTVYEGIPFSVTLTELLADRGLTYRYTGTVESGFYLAAIEGLDLTGNSITDGIWERVKDTYARTIAVGSSLGEFDYGTGSGWMYSVNGVYKNYGFSDYYPQDGDAVRVQFTVLLGEDLGGSGALGGGSSGGWLGDNPDYAPVMKLLADIGSDTAADKTVYNEVIKAVAEWNISQNAMDEQLEKLKKYYGAN